ncbi:hypothetical protein LC593_33270 [Nostoc sp. CHAB 5844]|nr:hypothetical protein [Nostoc sp. CHAB 5844]
MFVKSKLILALAIGNRTPLATSRGTRRQLPQVEPAACGETSAEGGFPSAGDWRSSKR